MLIGLHFFNVSVDTKDPYPEFIPEDLSINDQESIVEIIIEKLLGYEDAIVEYDDHDTEDHNKKTKSKIDLSIHAIVCNTINSLVFEIKGHKFPDYKTYLIKGFYKPDLPPPKV